MMISIPTFSLRFWCLVGCLSASPLVPVSLGLSRGGCVSSPPFFAAFLGGGSGGAPPPPQEAVAAAARSLRPSRSLSNVAAPPAVSAMQGKRAGFAAQESGRDRQQQHLYANTGTEEETEVPTEKAQQQQLECLLGGSNAREKEAADSAEEAVADRVPLTAEAVESVLDEIRPMLDTHGGSVRLLHTDPEKRQVTLQLQGACVGCPSAAVTLRNGIERTLQEVWAGLAVVEAAAETEGEGRDRSAEPIDARRVQEALKGILPAVQQMGGRLSITNTDNGGVMVSYEGPNAVTVKYGLEMELSDKLPGAAGLLVVEAREADS